MRRFLFIATVIGLTLQLANAQDKIPRTHLFLVPVKLENKHYAFDKPVAVPDAGTYNNQPYFTANGKTMYFVATSDKRKTDIYTLDVKKNQFQVWDSTNGTSEYSPQLTPDPKFLSFVRVESDDSTQHLYKRALRGAKDELLIKEPLKIGYYCWNSATTLLLYVLKKPSDELLLYDLAKKSYKVIDTDPGRAVVKNNLDGNVYYVKKRINGKHLLMQYNPANEQPAQFCEMPEGSEDFTVSPSGEIFASSGDKLMLWDTALEKWVEAFDFGKTDVKKFYRLAFSPDEKWLAVVSYEGEKP